MPCARGDKGVSALHPAPIRAWMSAHESALFEVDAKDDGEGVRINVASSDGRSRDYSLPGRESQHYFELFRDLHRDFGTRLPHFYAPPVGFPETPSNWRPLLTENAAP